MVNPQVCPKCGKQMMEIADDGSRVFCMSCGYEPETMAFSKKFVTVAIAGGFDPLHKGHIDHIRKAAALGDKLVIITHPDSVLCSKKGYCFMPLEDRIAVLNAIEEVDEVFVCEGYPYPPDGTVAGALRIIKPDIFAKGGDRTPTNMPQSELDVCKELGIEIRYGVGDLLSSSSKLMDEAVEHYLEAKGLIAVEHYDWAKRR